MTDNILKFPDHSMKRKQTLECAHRTYRKAGLRNDAAISAARELAGYLEKLDSLAAPPALILNQAGLTSEQNALITKAHQEWSAFHLQHKHDTIQIIAGLLGRYYDEVGPLA